MGQEIIKFIKQKDYEKITFLDEGSFGKVLLIRGVFIDEFFVVKKYDPDDMLDENNLENLNSIFIQLIEVFVYI